MDSDNLLRTRLTPERIGTLLYGQAMEPKRRDEVTPATLQQQGLTRKQIAEMYKVSRQAVEKWYKDGRLPKRRRYALPGSPHQ